MVTLYLICHHGWLLTFLLDSIIVMVICDILSWLLTFLLDSSCVALFICIRIQFMPIWLWDEFRWQLCNLGTIVRCFLVYITNSVEINDVIYKRILNCINLYNCAMYKQHIQIHNKWVYSIQYPNWPPLFW